MSIFPSYTSAYLSYGKIDGNIMDLQNINRTVLHSAQLISWRPVIMLSNLYINSYETRSGNVIKFANGSFNDNS